MNNEIYDKIYIHENYGKQFAGTRNNVRVQTANCREMPNANTVVLMQDTPDGGVTITTGDFVAYFNQRYGCDRVGAMRRSVAAAQRRCELRRANDARVKTKERQEKKQEVKKEVKTKKHFRIGLSFKRVALAMMLVLAIGMLFGSSVLLKNANAEVVALESEVEALQTANGNEALTVSEETVPVQAAFAASNSVEIYPVAQEEGFAISALMNALASMGNK